MRDEREFTQSSGDVFTDSGLDNPGELLSKANITAGSIWPFHGEFL